MTAEPQTVTRDEITLTANANPIHSDAIARPRIAHGHPVLFHPKHCVMPGQVFIFDLHRAIGRAPDRELPDRQQDLPIAIAEPKDCHRRRLARKCAPSSWTRVDSFRRSGRAATVWRCALLWALVSERTKTFQTSNESEERSLAESSVSRLVGDTLDSRYRIIETLKQGGMGIVYRAEQVRLGRSVAVKVLQSRSSRRAQERFRAEAEALAALDHENIATAFDFGWTEEGRPFLVMELIAGLDLRERLSAGPIEWREACRIATQIADGLHAAHGAGLVHRDLKPSNIMLERSSDGDRVRILDFGIAKSLAPTQEAGMTRPGDVLGTPGYMAPEQMLGDETDARADLYALGILLWEMLNGKRLFTGGPGPALRNQVPPIEAKVPTSLRVLVSELLDSNTTKRPASALEVSERLRAIQRPNHRMRYVTLSAVALMILGTAGVLAWRALDDKSTATATAAPAEPVVSTDSSPPEPPTVEDSPEESVQAAEIAVGPPNLAPPAPAEMVPEVVVEQATEPAPLPLRVLLRGRRSERRTAAHAILGADQATPTQRAIARLELASDCEAKARQIRRIGANGTRAALPALRRAQRLPDDGCGLLGRRDCYSCLRDDVRRAINTISRR